MNRSSFAIVWIIFIVNFLWEFFVMAELPAQLAPLLPGLLIASDCQLIASSTARSHCPQACWSYLFWASSWRLSSSLR
jgi:hypothetical protein